MYLFDFIFRNVCSIWAISANKYLHECNAIAHRVAAGKHVSVNLHARSSVHVQARLKVCCICLTAILAHGWLIQHYGQHTRDSIEFIAHFGTLMLYAFIQ